MYTVDLELHVDGKKYALTIKDKLGIVFQPIIKGDPYYSIFKRKDGDMWIVYGSNEERGFNFFNLTKKRTYDSTYLRMSRYNTYRNVLPSPTGQYLLFVDINHIIEFFCISKLGKDIKNPISFVIFVDKTGKWFYEGLHYTFKDASLLCVEWVSDRLIYRTSAYDIIFDTSKETLEWNGVTLFNLLESSMKNDV